MNNNNRKIPAINLIDGVFLVFLALKLSGSIDWSWWYVCAPLWVPATFLIVGGIFLILLDKIRLKLYAKRHKAKVVDRTFG
jgi:hypothetical protein